MSGPSEASVPHRALRFTVQWPGHVARVPSVVMTTGTRFGALAGPTHSEANGVDVEAREWGKRSHSDGGLGEGAGAQLLGRTQTHPPAGVQSPTSPTACWGRGWGGAGGWLSDINTELWNSVASNFPQSVAFGI